MGKKLDVEIRVGRVYTNKGEDYLHLTLEDDISGIQFADIEMSFEDFGRMLTGSGTVVRGEFMGLESIGKVREYEKATVVISTDEYLKIVGGVPYADQQKVLGKWLEQNHSREGWQVNTYLGSRGSIEHDYQDKQYKLNFGYTRYVDKQD